MFKSSLLAYSNYSEKFLTFEFYNKKKVKLFMLIVYKLTKTCMKSKIISITKLFDFLNSKLKESK